MNVDIETSLYRPGLQARIFNAVAYQSSRLYRDAAMPKHLPNANAWYGDIH